MNEHSKNNQKGAQAERLNVVSAPFSRYRAAETVLCLLAVICGLIYRFTGVPSMGAVLVIFTLAFGASPILRIVEKRRLHQPGGVFGIVFGIFFTLVTLTATVLYFVLY